MIFFQGFNYTIELVADSAHGKYNKKTKKWNGMIGELLSGVNWLFFKTYLHL